MSRWLYVTSGIAISLLLLFFANVINFRYQEDVRQNHFILSTLDESFQYDTDAWVLVNSLKTEAKDKREREICDKALECIGRSKDAVNRAKDSIGRK